MPSNLGYFKVIEQNRRSAKWTLSGPNKIGTDAIVSFGDVELPVHSMVIAAESQRIREMFEAERMETGRRQIRLTGANVHAVWRTLELIYCQNYTTSACPRSHIPGP